MFFNDINKIDSLSFQLPDDIVYISFAADYDISKKYIALLTYDNIIIYNNDSNIIKPIVRFNTRHTYSNIKISGDSCIIYGCEISSSNMGSKTHTTIGIIDIIQEKFVLKSELPDPQGVNFTLFTPRKLIDYDDGKLLLSDATNYLIRIFDNDLNILDTISRKPIKWQYIDDNSYNKVKLPKLINGSYDVKATINSLRPLLNSGSLIKKVNFINNYTILISWIDEIKQTNFDIWEEIDGDWTLVMSDQLGYRPKKSDKFYEMKRVPISQDYYCSDSFILGLDPLPFNIYQWDGTLGELYEATDDYYIYNELSYSLFIHKYVK